MPHRASDVAAISGLDDRRLPRADKAPWSLLQFGRAFYVAPRANPDFAWAFASRFLFAHHEWLRRQTFTQRALGVAYDSALEGVLLTCDRRDRLDKVIVEMAAQQAWSPVVTRLACLRGV